MKKINKQKVTQDFLKILAPPGSWQLAHIRTLIASTRKGRIKQFIHFIKNGHVIRSITIKNHYKTQPVIKLQIGGGKHLKSSDEWINADLIDGDIYLDATRRLPFKDNSIDLIFTEQFFEHISREEGLNFLKESFRVLKKGRGAQAVYS